MQTKTEPLSGYAMGEQYTAAQAAVEVFRDLRRELERALDEQHAQMRAQWAGALGGGTGPMRLAR